ncbi:hypothetical protein TSUD_156970 [Trifolium subterraneum]|uniref:Uncharacterized protein n=1 Tax=Trifolium subterraneum TaxID=3900 RepID=A0A2Z6M9E4_TRISU|nr:hypothetical protein TSUD_156970 [Trifolium subterraneum]
MATAPSNSSTAKVGTLGLSSPSSSVQPKSQRGQNKPKCKQCGNVARSRCPYECCKSCCSRNQNPCPIHGPRSTIENSGHYWRLKSGAIQVS